MSSRVCIFSVAILLATCAGCAREDRQAAPPPGREAPAGAATRLAGLGWEPVADGARFSLRFCRDDGAPARPDGPVEARVMRELGVLRLSLPAGISTTAVTDSAFAGTLAARAFVVRSLVNRALFVDLHAPTPIEASMAASSSPEEWAVLVRRGGGAWPKPPTSDRRVVVLSPRPGAPLDSLLVISGYARVFESTVAIRIEEGAAARDTFTTAADWAETWGEFRLTLPAPRSAASGLVGEYSAEDGSFQGVRIPLVRSVRADD